MEQGRIAAGASPREAEAEARGAWRQEADPENLDLLSFYGRYLVNQYAGMSNALNLDAVRTAMEIEGVEREAWPSMTERLVYLHGLVVDTLPKD